jgi:hypothetical protein
MPGGRRTDRISQRDLEVLEFVVRYGVVPRETVALWAGTGRGVTAARERRLREAGLIEVLPGFGNSGRLVLCTRQGLRAAGRGGLPAPRFSPATLLHSAAVASVAAKLEREGHRLLSEREIFARERAKGKRILSAQCPGGRYHRPDLILLGNPNEAIEVELTDKSARRLDELLRAWRRSVAARQFGRVRYLCSPRALPYVERAVERTSTDTVIDVEPLEQGGGQFALAAGSLLRSRHQGSEFSPPIPPADPPTSVAGFGPRSVAPASSPASPG